MSRYTRILSAAFAGDVLPLPVSAVVTRRAEPQPRCGDLDAHVSSMQTRPLPIEITLTVRDVSAAEALAIGSRGTVALEIASADGTTPGRSVRLTGAVLMSVETRYAQNAPAEGVLRLTCESTDGTTNPFLSEDQA